MTNSFTFRLRNQLLRWPWLAQAWRVVRRQAEKNGQHAAPAPMPFIVGVGRSGTTLLRLMLDAHPELAIPPETGFIFPIKGLPEAGPALRQQFFEAMTGFHTWPDINLSAEAFAQTLAAIEPFNLSDGIRAFYRLYAQRFNKPRWGDKTPVHARHMLEIQSLLPEARFIHIIRDGRDVALSVRPLWFAPGNGSLTAIAQDWVQTIQQARAEGRQCRHYLEVRYENLVRNTRAELRRICEFIELPYDRRMERYYESARARLDEVQPRYHTDGSVWITKEARLNIQRMTSQPPEASRLMRWKSEMSVAELAEFEAVAGTLLAELGYELSAGGTN